MNELYGLKIHVCVCVVSANNCSSNPVVGVTASQIDYVLHLVQHPSLLQTDLTHQVVLEVALGAFVALVVVMDVSLRWDVVVGAPYRVRWDVVVGVPYRVRWDVVVHTG